MHMGLRSLMNRSLWFLEMAVTLRYENHFSLVKRSLDMCIFRGSISHNFRPLKNDAEPGLRFRRFQVSYHWDSQRSGEYTHTHTHTQKPPKYNFPYKLTTSVLLLEFWSTRYAVIFLVHFSFTAHRLFIHFTGFTFCRNFM